MNSTIIGQIVTTAVNSASIGQIVTTVVNSTSIGQIVTSEQYYYRTNSYYSREQC